MIFPALANALIYSYNIVWLSLARKTPADLKIAFEEVSGQPAAISWIGDSLYNVVSFEVVDAHIQAIRGILNPDKLAYHNYILQMVWSDEHGEVVGVTVKPTSDIFAGMA